MFWLGKRGENSRKEGRERAMGDKETASLKRKGRDRGKERIFSLHLRLSKTAAKKYFYCIKIIFFYLNFNPNHVITGDIKNCIN